MDFINFREVMNEHIKKNIFSKEKLFTTDVNVDEMWNLYLDSFPSQANQIFRMRREYDCSCCKNFIKTLGNVVAIDGEKLISIWDFEIEDPVFSIVTKAMSNYVTSKHINGIFLSTREKISTQKNFEKYLDKILTFDHYYAIVPKKFICNKFEYNTLISRAIENHNMISKLLTKIPLQYIEIVNDLIQQNNLYRGQEWKESIKELLRLKKDFLSAKDKRLFFWNNWNNQTARILNTSIGTLLEDLADGKDLDYAVKSYEKIVAPENYKRPKPIFTQRMIENAKNTVAKLGYEDSLARRSATESDIPPEEFLFVNRDVKDKFIESPLDMLTPNKKNNRSQKLDKVKSVHYEEFLKSYLPSAKNIELFFNKELSKNLVTLSAPQNSYAKSIFEWNNPIGWNYNGNFADSSIKQNVRKAGGKTDGVLRFSIQWNDGEMYNGTDWDAHALIHNFNCTEHINYNHKRFKDFAALDVDIVMPLRNEPAVENIIFGKKTDSCVTFYVHCFSKRSSLGFKAEIEFNGSIFNYEYNGNVKNGMEVKIAQVDFLNNKIHHYATPINETNEKIWNLNTGTFVPVKMMFYSPNYWNEDKKGSKHLFFILKDCKTTDTFNGFFNEFLHANLKEHRRVFEALGAQCSYTPSDEQLSGLGFCLTKHDKVIVKINTSYEQIIELTF